MFVLRFTFENHRSFRDENDLVLVQPRLKTSRPIGETWASYTNRVAAVYGANASGKSGLLDALKYMQAMVRHSATSWAGQKTLPGAPFRLDDVSTKAPSSYALDFVLNDVRYEYGFVVKPTAIQREWLYYYPNGRKKILFERDADAKSLSFGRDLKGGEVTLSKATSARELVLSKGAASNNLQLWQVWHAITAHIFIADFGEARRQERLRSVVGEIADGTLALDDVETMLKVADIGITGAEVAEDETNPQMKTLLKKVFAVIGDSDETEEASDNSARDHVPVPDETELDAILLSAARNLSFKHIGASEKIYRLSSNLQSTGTLTWLSLAAPALKTIRIGGLLAVDELDASLHPQLAQVMIQMFQDERINRNHAQLLFTTHDTYFMSPSAEETLSPDEIWLVEKARDGASELFSLADFPNRSGQNLSRRYLQGRYGAIPSVAPSFLLSLVEGADRSAVAENHPEMRCEETIDVKSI